MASSRRPARPLRLISISQSRERRHSVRRSAMARRRNRHVGSTLDSFLKEEGIFESATLKAVKTVIAWQIEQEMKRQKINKSKMAKLMDTSRAQLNRVLDGTHDVTLDMITRAATALKKELVLSLR